MNRRENTFKKYLLKIMGTSWDVQSHEDQFSEGIADLSFACKGKGGWIELKQIEKMPEDLNKVIRPEKYTPIQVNWLNKRHKFGGNCFVFVKVGNRDYFIFEPYMARHIRKGMELSSYYSNCIWHWNPSVRKEQLISVLTTRSVNDHS